MSAPSTGRVYNAGENATMDEFLTSQQKQMQETLNSQDPKKTVIRYAIMIGGSVLFLVVLKILIKHKK